MGSSVMTRKDVHLIYRSKTIKQQLAVKWLQEVKKGNHAEAKRIRHEINALSDNLLEKYQVII